MEKCRLCYTETNKALCRSIFDNKLDPPIWKIIADLTNLIIIENDEYTKLVCLQCFEELRRFNCFRKMIINSDWRMRHNNCIFKSELIDIEDDLITFDNEDNDNSTKIYDTNRRSVENPITTADKDRTTTIEQTLANTANNCNDNHQPIKTDIDAYNLKQEIAEIEEDPLKIEKSPTENSNQSTTEKLHHCNSCGEQFTRNSSLKRHLKTIHSVDNKPFNCEICGRKFSEMYTLQTHLKIHTDEKPYQCDVCGKKFTEMYSLDSHTRVHTGEKPYQCDICKRQFSHISSVRNHLVIHTNEKPFNCEICGKNFKYRSSFWIHSKIHTGEKSFICQICGKGFSVNSHLKKHSLVHTGEKPYQCDICQKKFGQKYDYRRHLRTIHNRIDK